MPNHSHTLLCDFSLFFPPLHRVCVYFTDLQNFECKSNQLVKTTAAYKHADGKKVDGRRVLVDVERGRTVRGWLPRRLGGGLGGTRRGGPDQNIRHSGRDDGRDGRDRDRDGDRRRSRSRDRDRDRRRRRSRLASFLSYFIIFHIKSGPQIVFLIQQTYNADLIFGPIPQRITH